MANYNVPLLCGAILIWSGTIAAADSAVGSSDGQVQLSGAVLDEVVVTARKRSESLQNVPVAVEAFSPEQLKSNDATDLSKLAELSPQVIIGPYAIGTGGILTIRGISSGASDAGVDQSVSVVVDGVPLSRGRIISASLFDMQQVEVMKGPQALFFGKNSPAGVISMDTVDPTHDLQGYVTGGYEFNAAERFGEGAISGPIANSLTARLAFRVDEMGGWIQNDAVPMDDPLHPGVVLPGATAGNVGPDGTDVAGRLTLLWAPTDNFDAKFKLTYDRQKLNSLDPYSEVFCTGGKTQQYELGISLPGTSCQKNMTVSESSDAAKFAVNYPYGNFGVPYGDSKFTLGSLTLNGQIDQVKLTSTTGYYQQNFSGSLAADYSPLTEIYDAQHETYDLVTQELRANTELASPVNYMAGLYYEHSIRHWLNAPDLFHAALNPTAGNYTTVETTADETTDSYSAFAQARWDIVSSVELALGARYTHDQKKENLENEANNPAASALGILLYPQGEVLPSSYSGNNVSPELTLSWHPAPDQTLYGAYKTGYKSGGVSNGSLLTVGMTSEGLVFGPEKTRGGEIGFKADLFDRRLRLDVTAYFYNYNGLQVTSFEPATISFQIQNAAQARTEGLEASTTWLATNHVSFHGSIGYNRARYLSFTNAECYTNQTTAQGCVGGVQNLSGQPLNRAPNVALDVGGKYETAVTAAWKVAMTVDGSYSSAYMAEPDYAPGGEQSAFWRLNAGAHVLSEDGHFDIAVIGRNLTNTYYLINSAGLPGRTNDEYLGTFGRPREVMVQAQYHY